MPSMRVHSTNMRLQLFLAQTNFVSLCWRSAHSSINASKTAKSPKTTLDPEHGWESAQTEIDVRKIRMWNRSEVEKRNWCQWFHRFNCFRESACNLFSLHHISPMWGNVFAMLTSVEWKLCVGGGGDFNRKPYFTGSEHMIINNESKR